MAQTIERILLLGMTPLAAQLVAEIDRGPDPKRRVIGVLDDHPPPPGHPMAAWFLGPLRALSAVVDDLQPHRIVVALTDRRGRIPVDTLLDYHISRGIFVEDAADCFERLTGKLALEALTPMNMMNFGANRPSTAHQVCAEWAGRSMALIALVLGAPLLALIAVAIKITSRGPVLFIQNRVGAHGRPFPLIKFRTMRTGPTPRSEWECDNRDRVTGLGACLRAFRLDELPQLVNVLRGEMSLIGPRPHPASNQELFTLVGRNLIDRTGVPVSCYALRGLVRPGLSGWAQVRYRYANNLEEEMEKLRYDLYYVKHQSMWFDLRILVETLRPLLRGRIGRPAVAAVPVEAPQPHARPIGAAPSRVANSAARRATVGTVLLLTLLISQPRALAGQTLESKPAPSTPATRDVARSLDYRIGVDDVIEIAVWDNAAIGRTSLVRPDGKISLPLLHDVLVAGLTPMQLQSWLTQALSGYVKSPQVSVIVREVHSLKVSVIGEVKTPGSYPMTQRSTILEVLAMAGGLTTFAKKSGIVLIRQDGASSVRVPIDYDALMTGKQWNGGRGNFAVLPGDVIVVR